MTFRCLRKGLRIVSLTSNHQTLDFKFGNRITQKVMSSNKKNDLAPIVTHALAGLAGAAIGGKVSYDYGYNKGWQNGYTQARIDFVEQQLRDMRIEVSQALSIMHDKQLSQEKRLERLEQAFVALLNKIQQQQEQQTVPALPNKSNYTQ